MKSVGDLVCAYLSVSPPGFNLASDSLHAEVKLSYYICVSCNTIWWATATYTASFIPFPVIMAPQIRGIVSVWLYENMW